MFTSKYLLSTIKEIPINTEVISHQLMIRSGMIRQISSGLYTWLPTGLRILQKTKKIIREEMNKTGALEICVPIVQPGTLWKESGRWEQYGTELLKFKNRKNNDFVLGPTDEEIIAYIIKNEINSYKKLPIIVYQIQNKFRDEIRPNYGIIRSKEFIMKDGYSFHMNQESLQNTYEVMYQTYSNIFNKIGLNFHVIKANNGNIGGNISHEFQAINNPSINNIKKSKNTQLIKQQSINNKKNSILIKNGIEIGHIFQLGNKYSKKIKVQNKCNYDILMGCYGIGLHRVIAANIEQHHDNHGILWPEVLAPFNVAIVPINMQKFNKVNQAANKLYNELSSINIDVLLDDRIEHIGVMLADIDLIGIPHIIIISNHFLQAGEIEYKHRLTGKRKKIKIVNIINFLINQIKFTK